MYYAIIQYNKIEANTKTITEHYNQIFHNIIEYVDQLEGITDIIITGNINQNISLKAVQEFFKHLSIADVHSIHNSINIK